jgi:hypothetical protein
MPLGQEQVEKEVEEEEGLPLKPVLKATKKSTKHRRLSQMRLEWGEGTQQRYS